MARRFKQWRKEGISSSPMVAVMFCSYGDAWTRTSALVNVGSLLVQQGNRVACTSLLRQSYLMDQLFAGGDNAEIHAIRQKPGLFDLLHEYRYAMLSAPYEPSTELLSLPQDSVSLGTLRLRRPSRCLIKASIVIPGSAPLYLLRGGPRMLGARGQSDTLGDPLDWGELRSRWGGDIYFDWLKYDLSSCVDFLFVDCEPGADAHFALEMLATSADTLVMLSDYSNDQTASAYHFLADLTGVDEGVERPHPACIIPVPAGIGVAEMELVSQGRKGFEFNFAKFLPKGWEGDSLRQWEIPTVPDYYRFTTKVVAWGEPKGGTDALLTAYKHLADAILHSRQLASAPQTESILSERMAGVMGRQNWDVFVSYSINDYDIALDLRHNLLRRGLRPFVSQCDLTSQTGSSEWLAAIQRVLDRTRVLVVLLTPSAQKSVWVEKECNDFHDRVQSGRKGMLIPVCLAPVTSQDLDDRLTRYQAVNCPNGLAQDTMEQVIGLVRGA